ncbi:MAG: hypothetical protein ACI4OE_07105 [Alphaproteobacteria bacterium]
MWKKNARRYTAGLMLTVMSCLTSCAAVNSDVCYVWPVGGKKVATELEKLSYSEYPNTWEWLGRLNKLRQELELCK